MMSVPDTVLRLIEHFDQNKSAYSTSAYNETQVRREFIDPFFEALGWDIGNVRGYAEQYKEVIHEDMIKVGSATKAPDYSFRIGGYRKFFVEAKKPSVNVKDEISPAYQLRRYAWSAKLPLSILTDFHELAVYDCRIRPLPTDKASTARVRYFTYLEYVDHWDEIAGTFSREAVLKGSFDKYAEENRGKKGTAEVDAAFLKEIEAWRDMLARNLALRNTNLTQRELNFAIQRTIDRIVFLRICEDRGIEQYGRLQALLNGENVYRRLCQMFQQADARYNSGLFHFRAEKEHTEPPDTLTLELQADDKPLKDIIRNLYYPDSPYEFSVLPADILGQVYEQFLGKVIRLTAGHRAVVEDKPEVKKAGGVYYTPTYIVDYIVKNTVGKLLEGKAPKGAAKLRILDPACGSGSFLIGAYQHLLDWHRDWYVNDGTEKWAKGRSPALFESQGGEWRLTTDERKRILLNSIYGVDIDPQAAETTKLSLLLKVLEGENEQTLSRQLKMFHERVLPDLGDNIKCGNSLIGPDFYNGEQMTLLDAAERYRINAFDWNAEFADIMKSGGFDAVVGNPPYRMLQPHNTAESVLAYLRKKYVAAEFKIEMFHLFVQRGVSLLREKGLHAYILPTTLLNNVYAESLRSWVMDQCCIESISVAREKVFAGADVHTSVVMLQRESNPERRRSQEIQTTSDLSQSFVYGPKVFSRTCQYRFLDIPGRVWNILLNEQNASLLLRLTRNFTPLGTVGVINRGLITGDREKYFARRQVSKDYVAILSGRDVHRYFALPPSEFVLFQRPGTAGGCWDPEVHLAPHKLVFRQISRGPTATLLREPIAVTGNVFTVRAATVDEELYLLGIANSRLMGFFWRVMFADFKTSFPQVTIFSLGQLPMRVLDPTLPADRTLRDRMVILVDRVLGLHAELHGTKTEYETASVERQISAVDAQIDQLVYELYGLTEEEIRIVQEG